MTRHQQSLKGSGKVVHGIFGGGMEMFLPLTRMFIDASEDLKCQWQEAAG